MKTPIPFVCSPHYTVAPQWIVALQAAMPEEVIMPFDTLDAQQKAACTVAIIANPDPAHIAQMPQLKWIHSVWAGVERVVADLGHTHLDIVRLIDPQLADTMAEAVLAWTMYLHRDMPAYAEQQRAKQWRTLDYTLARQRSVGVLGLGALGDAAAKRLLASNFRVNGWSRSKKNVDGVNCYTGADELQAMLAASDIVVCLLPLTAETKGLLNAEKLAWMKPGAQLINFGRGPIIDDDALKAALDSGALKHAVLDVFAVEPLPPTQWQWSHPGVTVLPHISAPTDRDTASAIVAGNIRAYRENGVIPTAVNTQRGY